MWVCSGVLDVLFVCGTLEAEAEAASVNFAVRLSRDLDALIARQAQRHTGWFTRGRYEILLLAMLGFLLFRLGKNFFYYFWRSDVPLPMWGLESYLALAFWLGLWCFLLLWMFMRRLRGGLKQAVDRLAENWIGIAARFRRFRGIGKRVSAGRGVPPRPGIASR